MTISIKRGDLPGKLWILYVLVFGILPCATHAQNALPGFEYQQFNVKFAKVDGAPVAGASVYGFSLDFNLIWPRRDHEFQGRNDVLWDESFLGKTGPDGSVSVVVPPGRWGFFAVGQALAGASSGPIVAAWSDFTARKTGDTVLLKPAVAKQWTLCSGDGGALTAKRLFLKPNGYPIWIPASVPQGAGALAIELADGPFALWADGDATSDHPGFALSFGEISNRMDDGRLRAVNHTGTLECKGGNGKAVLSWTRWDAFGLRDEMKLRDGAQVTLLPGDFTFAYRRPISSEVTGVFVGKWYRVVEGTPVKLDFDGPLTAGVEDSLNKPDKKGVIKLSARLFALDSNAQLLTELIDATGAPVGIKCAVSVGDKHFSARSVPARDDATEAQEAGPTMFEANVGDLLEAAGTIWNFTAPPGVLQESQLRGGAALTSVASASFQIQVPDLVRPVAQNILAQTEVLAQTMDRMSGRRRRIEHTDIRVTPGDKGAVGAHNGSGLSIGTKIFYSDMPILRHDLAHELAHNFNFTHGGLMETVVETSRCGVGAQISQQPAKWFFWDRMNGVNHKESGYHNVGLYLYCYAQGGLNFLHFMSAREPTVMKSLSKQGYTADELTAALCSAGLGRDMTAVCRAYGLTADPERVTQAMRDPKFSSLPR